ncbi:DnaA regulatory inactivator Hda [Aliikangiella maris]|uniref:DnaA regulatory inactivator Hda n=2 Tax=Aliikangiella maris TaxID=3162458 RepID=A0ABV2BP32_9GAMM
MYQLPLNVQLDDSADFTNFLSAHNAQLINRLQSMHSHSHDFIFVWGQTETGKTHLASAVCHEASNKNLNVAYLPVDNPAIMPEILQGMATMDIICIDNVETILGNPEWEIKLFDLYNNLNNEKKSLIIFSRLPLNEAPTKLADLQSRLMAMEIYRLIPLDDEQKIELMIKRAANRGLELSAEVSRYIITHYSRSVDQLIHMLEKLDRSSMSLQRKITIPLVKEIFKDNAAS